MSVIHKVHRLQNQKNMRETRKKNTISGQNGIRFVSTQQRLHGSMDSGIDTEIAHFSLANEKVVLDHSVCSS